MHADDDFPTAQRFVLPISFPVDLSLPYLIVNSPEKKLAKHTSLHCGGLACQKSTMNAKSAYLNRNLDTWKNCDYSLQCGQG